MTSQLNQNMIQQFFIDSGTIHNSQHTKSPSQSNIRRDQTFNLSLTSRESHHHNQRSHAQNTMKSLSDSESIISLGLNQLKKLNQFVQTYCSKSVILGGQLQQAEKSVKSIPETNPTVFNDFMVLKQQALNSKYNFQSRRSCETCSKIQQQNNIIQEECELRLCSMEQRYEIQMRQLQNEKQKLIDQNAKQSILHVTQLNLLKDVNQKLEKRVKQLTAQIQHINLERSELFQKTKNTEERIKLDISKFRSTSITKNSTHGESLPRNSESMIFDPYSQSDYGDLISIFFTQNLSIQMKEYMESRDLRSSVQSDHKPNDIEKLVRMYEKLIRQLNQIKQFRRKHGVQLPRQQTEQRRINILDNSKEVSKLNQFPESLANLEQQNKQLIRIKKSLTKQNENLTKNINELRSIQKNMSTRHINQIQNLKVEQQEMKEIIQQLSIKLKQKEQQLEKTFNQIKALRIYQTENKSLKYNFLKQRQQKKKAIVCLQNYRGPLRIYCRFRPQLKNCRNRPNQKWMVRQKIDCPFDKIFSRDSSQSQVFNQVKSLLNCAFEGQNVCILSFGGINSGKTFTIHGNKQQRGLVQNFISQIYKTIEQQKDNTILLQAEVSMIQLYLDRIVDLNANKKDNMAVLLQDNQGNIVLSKNVLNKVSNKIEMQQVYARGLMNRRLRKNEPGQTAQSPLFFTIKLLIQDRKTQSIRKTQICFVDLTTLQLSDHQSPYAKKINFTISIIIRALYLIKNKQKPDIKYKETKALCLLQKYLNKKSKIALFVNLQPYQTAQNYQIMQLIHQSKKHSESQHTEKVQKTDRTSTSKHSHEKKFEQASLSKSPHSRDRRARSSLDNFE